MKPVISIFVPTKNRYIYLKNLIILVENFKDGRVELVINDNSDENKEILEFFQNHECRYTRYFYEPGFMTMSQNADHAFNHCKGDYVCMLGDDDAVLRNIGDCAEWMKANDIDAIRSTEIQLIYTDKESTMYFDDVRPRARFLNPLKELKKMLRKGLPEFGNIPKPYHGIVKREILKQIQEKAGTCFPGCTPDMSGAVASCFFVKRFVKVDIPVILPGLSQMNSGGLSGQILKLEEVPWISDDVRNNWEMNIPRIWSREFIWSESGSKGMRYIGHDEYIKYLDYNMMKCRYLVMHKQHAQKIKDSVDSKLPFYWAMFKTYLFVGGRYIINRKIRSLFNHKLNGVYNYTHECKNIFEAEEYFVRKGYLLSFTNLIIKQ